MNENTSQNNKVKSDSSQSASSEKNVRFTNEQTVRKKLWFCVGDPFFKPYLMLNSDS